MLASLHLSDTKRRRRVREMSSLLVFEYDGNDRARCGTQRGRPGDDVYDDELGKGVLDKVDSAFVLVEFGMSGEAKEVKRRPCTGVFVVNNC